MPPKKKFKDDKPVQLPGPIVTAANSEEEHTNFLQAFEKPTQIYRYLRTRHAYSPLFLHRTLYFMRHKAPKSGHYKRRSFSVDGLLSKLTKKLKSSDMWFRREDLKLVFTGLHNKDASTQNRDVDVEVYLLKCFHHTRKRHSSPFGRVSLGKVKVPINSDLNSNLSSSTIVVSPDMFNQVNGHMVRAYKLQVQVTGFNTETSPPNGFITDFNDTGSEKKRRRCSRGISCDDSHPSYLAELIIYDRHRRCDLTDGRYEIALQDSDINYGQLSPKWHADMKLGEQETTLEAFFKTPRLKFDLTWIKQTTDKCPYPINYPIGSLSFDPSVYRSEPERKPVISNESNQRLIYQFIYKGVTRQQTEAEADMKCPWCCVRCHRVYGLLKHLRLSHARFTFIYVPNPKGDRINVSINERYDGSYVGNPQDLHTHIGYAFSRSGPVRRTPVTHVIVYRPRRGVESLSEFIEGGHEIAVTREIIQGHNRLYYHTSTNQPLRPQDLEYDSEEENDPLWLRSKTSKMIDEFTDVNEGEKELMKMWNLHIMKHNFVGDCQVILACTTFVDIHGERIIRSNLQLNFLLHLVNLFDFNLIRPETVQKTIVQLSQLEASLQNQT